MKLYLKKKFLYYALKKYQRIFNLSLLIKILNKINKKKKVI